MLIFRRIQLLFFGAGKPTLKHSHTSRSGGVGREWYGSVWKGGGTTCRASPEGAPLELKLIAPLGTTHPHPGDALFLALVFLFLLGFYTPLAVKR